MDARADHDAGIILFPSLRARLAGANLTWLKLKPRLEAICFIDVIEKEVAMDAFRHFIGSPLGLACSLAVGAAGAYPLLTHTGHVLSAVPYLLLMACPLMHVFGHHHHGSGHRRQGEPPQ
jgi:hypothetical protein